MNLDVTRISNKVMGLIEPHIKSKNIKKKQTYLDNGGLLDFLRGSTASTVCVNVSNVDANNGVGVADVSVSIVSIGANIERTTDYSMEFFNIINPILETSLFVEQTGLDPTSFGTNHVFTINLRVT